MQTFQKSIAAPAEIQRVADTYKMGTISNEFGPNFALVRVRRTGGYMMLGMAGVLCLCGLASMAGGAAGWVIIIIGILPALAGIAFFAWASGLEHKAARLYLCEQGFIYKDGANAAQPFRWDQITQVWRNVIRVYQKNSLGQDDSLLRIMHSYTVERKDGYKITLNDAFSAVEVVGRVISEKTTLILLPAARESYARGETVGFGPVALNQQGLIKGSNVLPWQQIEAIDTKDGYVRTQRNGKWVHLEDISKIPNLAVFLALADSIRGRATPALQVLPGVPTPPANAFAANPAQLPASPASQPMQGSALEILQQRFARGEIDAATYQRMREQLRP
ncbi:MAG TPA: SHOCT domain-containing protein [Ktedonobacteraceae bacterium]